MPEITPAIYSQNLKTRGQTYFFDIRKASNGKKYLNISQSWTAKDGQRRRSTLTVFSDNLSDFNQMVNQMQDKVS